MYENRYQNVRPWYHNSWNLESDIKKGIVIRDKDEVDGVDGLREAMGMEGVKKYGFSLFSDNIIHYYLIEIQNIF